jgi:hypothetical protein
MNFGFKGFLGNLFGKGRIASPQPNLLNTKKPLRELRSGAVFLYVLAQAIKKLASWS